MRRAAGSEKNAGVEKASRSGEETAVPGIIVRDPLPDLLARNVARRRQRSGLPVQAGRQEKQEFLLLLRRQRVGGLFDFG